MEQKAKSDPWYLIGSLFEKVTARIQGVGWSQTNWGGKASSSKVDD